MSAQEVGTFTASYELHIPGAAIPETPEASVNSSLSLRVAAAGDRANVVLRYERVTEAHGSLKARTYVEELVRRLTLKYADILHAAVTYKLLNESFDLPQTSERNRVIRVQPARLRIGVTGPQALIVSRLLPTDLNTALQEFERLRVAPAPAFANELVIAREMFYVGMQTDNIIVRFLILYSALTLFSIFKGKDGGQKDVDALLMDDDRSLTPVNATIQRGGKTVNVSETEYTQARNAFVHAEGRSRDPQAAILQIERLKDAFQRAVGRILSNS